MWFVSVNFYAIIIIFHSIQIAPSTCMSNHLPMRLFHCRKTCCLSKFSPKTCFKKYIYEIYINQHVVTHYLLWRVHPYWFDSYCIRLESFGNQNKLHNYEKAQLSEKLTHKSAADMTNIFQLCAKNPCSHTHNACDHVSENMCTTFISNILKQYFQRTSTSNVVATNGLKWMAVQLLGIRAWTINFSSSSHSYCQHEVFVQEVYTFDKQLIIYFGVNTGHLWETVFQNSIGVTIGAYLSDISISYIKKNVTWGF